MKKPLISIITPTYNHKAYIEMCIKSVRHQSPNINWEMIIVDDCSTDSTGDIIRWFIKKDKRIKLITHKTNWGILKLQKTYNQALKVSKGEVIAILEGDDYWPEYKLDNQIAPFLADKGAVLSYGKWEFINNNGRHIYTRDYHFDKDKLNNNPVNSIFDLFLTLRFDIASSTVLIKRSALEAIGGFKSDKYYSFPDIPTYLALGKTGEFVFMNKVLGCYRRSRQSAWLFFTRKSESMGRKEMMMCINNFIVNKLNKDLISQEIINRQKKYLTIRKYTSWLSLLFNKII